MIKFIHKFMHKMFNLVRIFSIGGRKMTFVQKHVCEIAWYDVIVFLLQVLRLFSDNKTEHVYIPKISIMEKDFKNIRQSVFRENPPD